MILIDPQCGASPLSLVGALAGLDVDNRRGADVLPDRFDLPGGTTRRLRSFPARTPSGSSTRMRFERERSSESASIPSEALCELLASQWPSANQVMERTSAFMGELEKFGLRGNECGSCFLDGTGSAITAFAFFRMIHHFSHPVLSLSVGAGRGVVTCKDMPTPLPHPDVVAIAAEKSIPLRTLSQNRVLTDAAGLLMLSLAARFEQNLPSFIPTSQAWGADPEGIRVRAVSVKEERMEETWIVEAALDDVTGEELGRALEILQEVSLEAHIVQALGKKGRPLFLLRTLARTEQLGDVFDRYFRDTPTIGLRYWPVGKMMMERKVSKGEIVVDGCRLPARIKISRLGDIVKGKPEADDIRDMLDGKDK